MQAVDLQGKLNEYFSDDDKQIPVAHLKGVCKYGKKEACRYMFLYKGKFSCMKKTPMKSSVDSMVKDKRMQAFGDNCEGLGG
tara:strand:- start:2848 stop:3093 length:246 start_codon:yes stop_codon:yes gene_type:complete